MTIFNNLLYVLEGSKDKYTRILYLTMKVLHVDECLDEEPPSCPCFFIERIVFWCIIIVIVFMSSAIAWEARTTMHLNNHVLRVDLQEHSMLRQQQALYKHEQPVWMP